MTAVHLIGPDNAPPTPSFIKRIVVAARVPEAAEMEAAARAVCERYPPLLGCVIEVQTDAEPDWKKAVFNGPSPAGFALDLAMAKIWDMKFTDVGRTAFLAAYERVDETEVCAHRLYAAATVALLPKWNGKSLSEDSSGKVTPRQWKIYEARSASLPAEADFVRKERKAGRDPFATLTHGRFNRAYFLAQAAELAFAQMPNL